MSTTDIEVSPESEPAVEAEAASYQRRLTLFDGIMVVAGGIIGAGIFHTPAVVAEHVDTPTLMMAAWAICGAIMLIGVLCFAEISVRRPDTLGTRIVLAVTPIAVDVQLRCHVDHYSIERVN